MSDILQQLTRRIEVAYPSKDEAVKRLFKEKNLRIYFGIDPTGTDIHLGHTIQLLFLNFLAELGHKPILLIGDFTARIGDPTGKDKSRKALTEEEIKENMKTYLSQIHKVLPEGSYELKYNSQWLKDMTLEDVLGLANHATVQQMIVRDMFQERL